MTDVLAEATDVQNYVYALAATGDALPNGVSFAAHTTGLQRSDDGGVSWHGAFGSLDLDEPLPTTSVAMAAGPHGTNSVFAGVSGGVMCSYDNGATWNSAVLPTPPPFVATLAVSPQFAVDGTVFAGTIEDGLFVSIDRGAHWTAWNIGLLDYAIYCIAVSPDFVADSCVFVGTESGIFRSDNGGRFWHETAFPSDAAPILCLGLSPAFGQDGTLFAGTGDGLYVSRDRGASWQGLESSSARGAVNAVLVAPTFPKLAHLLILLDETLLISHDGGQLWEPCLLDGHDDTAVTAVAAPLGFENGSTLLVGLHDGGIGRYDIGRGI